MSVLHLQAPLTLHQLVVVVEEFYNHPVVGQELDAFRRFAPEIAATNVQEVGCGEFRWGDVVKHHVCADGLFHDGQGEYSFVI